MKKKEKITFYNIENILSKHALYNIIFGERSNGKTYQALKLILDDYVINGNQGAYLRRWEEDIKGENGRQIFDCFVTNELTGNYIEKITKGKYNDFKYRSRAYFLLRRDTNGNVIEEDYTPFCFSYSITGQEHSKGGSKLKIHYIVFDEILARGNYLDNEFILFQNLLSSIIRYREEPIIFMLGNTISKYGCPYFLEMGLSNIKKMKQNTIDIYTYGDTGLSVAVEYADMPSKKKPSDKYFAFNNPKLKMITSGGWEIAIYPHLSIKYLPKEVKLIFYIEFEEENLQCNLIRHENMQFLYVHRKTTPIQEDNKRLVYSFKIREEKNYVSTIRDTTTPIRKAILKLIAQKKVFYSSNEVGEIMNSYLIKCGIISS